MLFSLLKSGPCVSCNPDLTFRARTQWFAERDFDTKLSQRMKDPDSRAEDPPTEQYAQVLQYFGKFRKQSIGRGAVGNPPICLLMLIFWRAHYRTTKSWGEWSGETSATRCRGAALLSTPIWKRLHGNLERMAYSRCAYIRSKKQCVFSRFFLKWRTLECQSEHSIHEKAPENPGTNFPPHRSSKVFDAVKSWRMLLRKEAPSFHEPAPPSFEWFSVDKPWRSWVGRSTRTVKTAILSALALSRPQ